MKMTQLISSVSELRENIRRYNEHAREFAELMPYARSWYALASGTVWLFGPSKFIGYHAMSPQDYLGSPYEPQRHGRVHRNDVNSVLDGRVTEKILQRWSTLIEEGHPDFERLHTALNEMCARHGKKPNSLARISIVSPESGSPAQSFTDDLVSLLAAVYRALTPAQRSAFRRQIA
jgi:hypothetical protein